MTLEEIKRIIEGIRGNASDDKAAHGREDDLYLDFIKFISETPMVSDSVREMAQEVLKTQVIDFERWCS